MIAELHASDPNFRDQVVGWVTGKVRSGSRVLLIDGLPGSGKTALAQELQGALDGARVVHLDAFLRRGREGALPWSDAVIRGDAAREIRDAVSAAGGLAIIEGACASEVWERVAPAPELAVVRIYARKLSVSGGLVSWTDGEWLDPEALGIRRSAFMQSIDDYHRARRPWLSADLVVSRIDEDGLASEGVV